MTATQFRTALARLDLSYGRAAAMLGVSRRTVIYYATGGVAVPEPVARLLRIIIEHEIAPETVEASR
jgi:predicted transcriptional regulator